MTSIQARTPSSAMPQTVSATLSSAVRPLAQSMPQSAGELALVDDARASAHISAPIQLATVHDLEKAHAVDAKGTREKQWRRMTPGEVEMVRKVFGDSINPNKVKIYSRKFFPFQPDYTVMTPFGSVYYPPKVYEEDFSKGTLWDKWLFLHELAHSWQHQSGHLVAVEAGVLHLMWWKDPYKYTPMKPGKDLGRYNLEQQASIIASYATGRLLDSKERYEDALANFLKDPNYRKREIRVRRAEQRARRNHGRPGHRRPRTVNVPASRPVHNTIQINELRDALDAMAGKGRPVATPQSVRDAIAEHMASDNLITDREMADIYMRAKVAQMPKDEINALMGELETKAQELQNAQLK